MVEELTDSLMRTESGEGRRPMRDQLVASWQVIDYRLHVTL